ncbi:MAG TPA: beta-ketoacyl synthase N-terminal-like domain-containing protein [Cytophagaceae bacterium]|jgi:3-oxoacyl-[acyl-carrier-protein] synthase-1|nr:beta-ketoacyl synthase N-terminal-like domain-containing protein [Cytophagaceae bacterium]
MKDVFIISDAIVSPLGFTSEENYLNLQKGISGIRKRKPPTPFTDSLYLSTMEEELLEEKFRSISKNKNYTKIEKLLILSIIETLKGTSVDIKSNNFLMILSTTKGNIDLLEETKKNNFPENRVYLWSIALIIQNYFGTAHTPLIISNACISGVNALICAGRLIRDGLYQHILVAGADIVSPFVVSGFQSFKAISERPCKPFDKNRNGINLGEGCGAILLSADKTVSQKNENIKMLGGAISNDANHISGPSRTGDGLYLAISNALKVSNITSDDIHYLNAHGTATLYNDEMESKAFHLAGLSNTPMNGIKGFYGHTLGAAGLIETIIAMKCMLSNEILPTLGFEEPGTPEKVNVSNHFLKTDIHYLLKTASGFGGGNAALIMEKNV